MGFTSRLVRRLGATAAAAALAAMLSVSTAAAQERVRWGVPIAFGSNLTALGDTLPWVADRLRAMSGGRIDLRVQEPGTVIPALGVFDAVSEGKVDAGYSWMGYEIGKIPASALYGATPFGMEALEFSAWYWFHGGKELLERIYARHNVVPIFCGAISPEGAGWFRQQITSLDQVRGLRFRAAGLGGRIWERVGASVQLIPGPELYQALERGVLDGTEFSLPTVDEQLGFHRVAKFLHLPGWHQPTTNQFLYVNKRVWDGLQDTTRAMIETACQAGVAYAMARAEALQGAALKRFAEQGVTVAQLPKDVLERLQAATKEVLDEQAARDADFRAVLESMRRFQAEHASWKQLGYLPRDWPLTR
ncbi:MAG: TRAP transporter substrate-binding protein [Elioraea sp.]|nr:TRAP transporter substrate-binding protein [Elioraea sp.]